ncbi:hypothetical protein KKHFBJBL_02584 [Brevundimonas sp. NIBR11]|nr:hypothetical protein KKHFBJBL_02584 [Brevundimonas sp. NIBR11]
MPTFAEAERPALPGCPYTRWATLADPVGDGASARAEKHFIGPRNAKAGGHLVPGDRPGSVDFPNPFAAEER